MNKKEHKGIIILAVILLFLLLIIRTIIESKREKEYVENRITEEDLNIPLEELEYGFIEDQELLRNVRIEYFDKDHIRKVIIIDFVDEKKKEGYRGSDISHYHTVDFMITKRFKNVMKKCLNDSMNYYVISKDSMENGVRIDAYGTKHHIILGTSEGYPEFWNELWTYVNPE